MLYPSLWFSAYTKKSHTFFSNTYGSYSSLLNAKAACTSDSTCVGIMVEAVDDVDDSGTFELCPKSTTFESHYYWVVYTKGKWNVH